MSGAKLAHIYIHMYGICHRICGIVGKELEAFFIRVIRRGVGPQTGFELNAVKVGRFVNEPLSQLYLMKCC